MKQQSRYEVIDGNKELGGQVYPFLNSFDHWAVEAFDHPTWSKMANSAERFSALTAVRDSGVLRFHAEGMGDQALMEKLGIQISMEKGAFVASKRLVRMMRPFRYWAMHASTDIVIGRNVNANPDLWDGAGQISAKYVKELAYAKHLDLTQKQRRRLAKAKRVEITVMGPFGQEKAHCLVVDDLMGEVEGAKVECDLVLPPNSTKTEVKFCDPFGTVFVGVVPVKGKRSMRIDIQSLINLGGPNGFFQPAQLLAWLRMEGEFVLQGLNDGHHNKAMLNRIANAETDEELENILNWHVPQFLAAGGQPAWFAGIIRSIARRYSEKLYQKVSKKFRFPIPGGRLYIFPAEVGSKTVAEGECELDFDTGSIWVNDSDFLSYIGRVAGGCDHDDAFWVFPFVDHDGERKVLAWRSPNQLGEYIVLKPSADSDEIQWETALGNIAWPTMDSRLLPPRIDGIKTTYLDLIQEDEFGEDRLYDYGLIQKAIVQSRSNAGVLGAMCNLLMVARAINPNWTPREMPARLEEIIDASVKTGADLTSVMEWIQAMVTKLAANCAIPKVLLPRIEASLSEAEARQVKLDPNNWVQLLTDGALDYLAEFQSEVDAIAAVAMPPVTVLQAGQAYLEIGERVRAQYGSIVNPKNMDKLRNQLDAGRISWSEYNEARMGLIERARRETLALIAHLPAEEQRNALLGAVTAVYTAPPPKAGAPRTDGVLWQIAEDDESPAFGELLIQAMQSLNILGEISWDADGGTVVKQPKLVELTVTAVWFNLLREKLAVAGYPLPEKMGEVSKADNTLAKQYLAQKIGSFVGQTLVIDKEKDRMSVTDSAGTLLGFTRTLCGQFNTLKIVAASTKDGNMRIVAEAV
ncbi:MAG: hypothetical protein AAGD96_17970 [Chloroflexota bacterium]